MTATPVRFAYANARMRALKGTLWTPADLAMLVQAGIAPDGRAPSGAFAHVMPGLVQWYVTLTRAYAPARALFLSLFRLHEIENLKLLWRLVERRRPMIPALWRPLEPLAALPRFDVPASLEDLVERLRATPYGPIAATILRSHRTDPAAAEIGFDRWALAKVYGEARQLSDRDTAGRSLLSGVIRERDADMLRRARTTFHLAPDLAARSTTLLADEFGFRALIPAAVWQPGGGPLWQSLPPGLVRRSGRVDDWDALQVALRRDRLRECRRAFVAWPYSVSPAIAALLLREEQARVATGLAAGAGSDVADRALRLRVAAAHGIEV